MLCSRRTHGGADARCSRAPVGWRAQFAAIALASLVCTFGADAPALQPVFSLGRISLSGVQHESLRDELKTALREELESPQFAKLRARQRYVISARLLTLNSARSSSSARVSCQVSLVLQRRSSDSLAAVITGRATAEDGQEPRSAEHAALRAAVHGAMRRVPATLASLTD